MKGKYKTLVILLLISGYSFSQVPGYMGKRFTIGYDVYLFPAIRGPGVHNAEPSNKFSTGLNNAHCINIDYTIKQRTNICLSFQYLQTGIAYKANVSGGLNAGTDPYPYPGHVRYGGDFSVPAKLSSFNIGLGFKFFKKGEIAPVGKYQKLELLLFFETVNYNKSKFYKIDNSSIYGAEVPYTAGKGEYSYTNFAITYTVGRQRVFFDKLVLDYGFRFGIVPLIIPIVISQDINNSNNSSFPIMENIYRESSASRLFRQQLLNVHIGLGFLAF